MQSIKQNNLNASLVEKTDIAIVLEAQEQQKENSQEMIAGQTTMNTQNVFPSGWIKYRKSGYQGL